MSRGAVARVLLALLPWTWFLVRDWSVWFELVAVALPLLVAVAIAACVVRRAALIGASCLVMGIVAVVIPWIPHSTGHPVDGVTITVSNTLTQNGRAADVVADIVAQHPDIAVVPEANPAVDARLSAIFPNHLRRPLRDGAAIGVYSRLPITELPFVDGLLGHSRQIRVEVDHRFVLWAVHLPKPWLKPAGGYEMRPPSHARVVSGLLRAFDAETMPVVVAGDTNLTDRGRAYRKMTAHLDDALRGIWGGPTARKWYLRPLLLRIDHVFVPEDWCADHGHRFELSGSDHRGVRVRVGPCAR